MKDLTKGSVGGHILQLSLFIAMSTQLWSTGWVNGATAFESATFPGFAHAPRNRVGLLFRQTQASEGIIH